MTKQFWSKFNHAKHIMDTVRLTRSARCAYYDLYNACFAEGGFLPDDDAFLSRSTGVSVEEWKQIRPEIERLFIIDKRGWHHSDLLAEMISAESKIRERRMAGSKGGKSRSLKDKQNPSSKTNGLPNQLQLHSDLESDLQGDSDPDSDLESVFYMGVSDRQIMDPIEAQGKVVSIRDPMEPEIATKMQHAKAVIREFQQFGVPHPTGYENLTLDQARTLATEHLRWNTRSNRRRAESADRTGSQRPAEAVQSRKSMPDGYE